MNQISVVKRFDVLNALITQHGYTSYLEIGIQNPGNNFDRVNCADKTGIDPFPLRKDILNFTSDEFFTQLHKNQKFDLIFIDGLHHYDQVYTDIINSLKHLSPRGSIVCHDMLPESELMQIVPMLPQAIMAWTGDCWKAWAILRMTEKDLSMKVIDCDFGVGVIRKGSQDLFAHQVPVSAMNYGFFTSHRNELMNVDEFSNVVAP
jgi:hypothetical protein